MTSVPDMADHEVFRVEQWGDTLVVIPRGDAVGFNIQQVYLEQGRVLQLARSGGFQHLIVDLSQANYFGSIVLGVLLQLGQMVRDRRGRTALASASGDMQDVLRLLKLDEMWELYPDQHAALRRLARIPLRERLWAQRHAVLALLTIVAVVLAVVFFPKPNYGRRYCTELETLWREAQAKRKLAGDEEWANFRKRADNKLEPMLKHLERRTMANNTSAAEYHLIQIMKYNWKDAMDRSSPFIEVHIRTLQYHLDSAKAHVEGRPLPRMNLDGRPDEPKKRKSKAAR